MIIDNVVATIRLIGIYLKSFLSVLKITINTHAYNILGTVSYVQYGSMNRS